MLVVDSAFSASLWAILVNYTVYQISFDLFSLFLRRNM
uniref:Uncharacterized protein n=1 Tax=Arundo donax TaxID=35708 RepID=A0A0A9H129_ARUDO